MVLGGLAGLLEFLDCNGSPDNIVGRKWALFRD